MTGEEEGPVPLRHITWRLRLRLAPRLRSTLGANARLHGRRRSGGSETRVVAVRFR